MILGHVRIFEGAVHTHKDSYLLENLTVVSVRRPLLGGAVLFVTGIGSFAFAFVDLLFAGELIFVAALTAITALAGHQIGQLKLISRETKGTALADAVWGQAAALQKIRTEIVNELRRRSHQGDLS